MHYPVIGITGRAYSGKDTVAGFILAHTGGYQYSFADPIRGMLTVLGINMHDPYWKARKEEIIPAIGKSPRQIMQTLGTDWGRKMVHPDLWLTMASQALINNGPGMVIADVRFDNEAEWVRKMGGRIIHVERGARPEVAEHESENGVKALPEDLVLVNNSSLEDLQAMVQEKLSGFSQTRDHIHPGGA